MDNELTPMDGPNRPEANSTSTSNSDTGKRRGFSRRELLLGTATVAAAALAPGVAEAGTFTEPDQLRKEIDLPGKEFFDEWRGVCAGDKDSMREAINSLRAAYNTDNKAELHEAETASSYRRYTSPFMAAVLLEENQLTDDPKKAKGNFINKDRFHTLFTSDSSQPEKNPLDAYRLIRGGYHVCTAVVTEACRKYGVEIPTEPNTPDAWRVAIELLEKMKDGIQSNNENPDVTDIEPESRIRILIVGIATGVVSFEDFADKPYERAILSKAMTNILSRASSIDFEHKNIDRSPSNAEAIDSLLSDYSDESRFGDEANNPNGEAYGLNFMARHGLSRESWDISASIDRMKNMLNQQSQNTSISGIA